MSCTRRHRRDFRPGSHQQREDTFWSTSGPNGVAPAALSARSSTRSPLEHSDKIDIVKLNVDDNPELAAKYQITSIPAMKVFQKGEVVKTVIGAKPKPALEADLAAYLA